MRVMPKFGVELGIGEEAEWAAGMSGGTVSERSDEGEERGVERVAVEVEAVDVRAQVPRQRLRAHVHVQRLARHQRRPAERKSRVTRRQCNKYRKRGEQIKK